MFIFWIQVAKGLVKLKLKVIKQKTKRGQGGWFNFQFRQQCYNGGNKYGKKLVTYWGIEPRLPSYKFFFFSFNFFGNTLIFNSYIKFWIIYSQIGSNMLITPIKKSLKGGKKKALDRSRIFWKPLCCHFFHLDSPMWQSCKSEANTHWSSLFILYSNFHHCRSQGNNSF